ncbi:glycoside hydrolase family 93 protein [Thermothielavioides terrestris NRRL 8126]|uniref:Glycoside hydrolase family 93 protein n=1 Tax=Thermothielavioides terrestris (strain ATCC 38088 / NRRL 8126) TaxID=578455 RepID=G2R959_THETT|nr:glycoside hydrolase family 93 protein [Thermothielavioides terrestris NRRL 8126]AEO68654.1 glycoside hydrolase family 93 protein [Thermothielavioides terrestris NRRL 8126]
MDIAARRLHVGREEHFVHDVPGTYPRLCRSADGSILAGFTAFEADGQRVLTVARSVDGARSFQPHGEVTRSRGDCDNLFLLQLPGPPLDDPDLRGPHAHMPILAAFRNHDLDAAGNPTWFRITVCRSLDGGRSWSFLSQAFEKPAPFGLWEPFLRIGRRLGDNDDYDDDNRWEVHLYFSQELAHDDQDTMLVRSADGGATWSAPVAVTGMGEALRDGMVGVAASDYPGRLWRDKALVMVLETTRRGTFSIEALVSFDGGKTFASRQVVYEPAAGRNAGAPQIAALEDGTLVVVFMTDEDGPGEPQWPRRAKIKAVHGRLLADGKLALSAPEVVEEAASFWPGIMSILSSSALAVYESSSRIRGRLLRSGPAEEQ